MMSVWVFAICWANLTAILRRVFGLRIIGLTGGIASGKSTASRYLWQQHGACIIDFDQLARVVVQPGKPAFLNLVAAFGKDILHADGTLNRELMAERCFGDRTQLRRLNACMKWPMAREILKQTLNAFFVKRRRVVIWDAPLLFEQGLHHGCQSTLMIYVPHHIELARLCQRDKIEMDTAAKKIASQWPLDRKRGMAHTVITNDGTMEQLQRSLTRWWCEIQGVTIPSATIAPATTADTATTVTNNASDSTTIGERPESLISSITRPTFVAALLACPLAIATTCMIHFMSSRAK